MHPLGAVGGYSGICFVAENGSLLRLSFCGGTWWYGQQRVNSPGGQAEAEESLLFGSSHEKRGSSEAFGELKVIQKQLQALFNPFWQVRNRPPQLLDDFVFLTF